jgi:tetratricopeptide (TPR) repeat protein
MQIGLFIHKIVSALSFSTEVWMSLLLGAIVTIVIAYVIYRIQKKETKIHKQDHDAKLEEIKLLHQQDSEKIKVLYELIIQSQRGSIGELESAVLEQKIEVAAEQITEQDSDKAQALKAIAENDKEEADDLLDKIAQREHDLVEVYNLRALNEYRNCFYAEAVKWCRKIVELEPDNLDSIQHLMEVLLKADLDLEARELAVKTLDKLEQAGSGDIDHIFVFLQGIILSYDFQNETELAKPYLDRLLEFIQKHYSEQSYETCWIYGMFGSYYSFSQQYKESEVYYLKTIAIYETLSKDEMDNYDIIYCSLARIYCDTGRYQEALLLLEKAYNMRVAAVGENHLSLRTVLNDQARVYMELGKYSDAETCIMKVLSLVEEKLGKNHSQYLNYARSLGVLYFYMQRFSEAEVIFRDLLVKNTDKHGQESYHVAMTLYTLSVSLSKQNKQDEAEQLLHRALSIFEKVAPPEDGQFVAAKSNLATLNYEKGNYEDAEQGILHVIDVLKKLGREESLDMAKLQGNLAKVYEKQERWTEAETLLQSVLSCYAEKAPDNKEQIEYLRRYSTVLEKLDRQDEAERYKAKVEELESKQELEP